jgi:hypothetical protein
LWCDGMGTSRELNRSIVRTAGFVLKLHRAFAVAHSEVQTIQSYPVMDGLYVTTGSRNDLRRAIGLAFVQFARDFIGGHGTQNKFMMRGGLAYGPVLHGKDIPEEAFADAEPIRETKRSILLSPAMVLAYRAESKAPPFGIYVDDSAKTFPQLTRPEDKGFISNLYQWWRDDADATAVARELYGQITFYLAKSKVHSIGMGYDMDRIEAHEQLAAEYFGGLQKASDAQQPPAGDVPEAAPEE